MIEIKFVFDDEYNNLAWIDDNYKDIIFYNLNYYTIESGKIINFVIIDIIETFLIEFICSLSYKDKIFDRDKLCPYDNNRDHYTCPIYQICKAMTKNEITISEV